MIDPSATPITLLLQGWRNGDPSAERQLFSAVYRELRGLAGRLMQPERRDHTLQPTALVHEAYLRLFPTAADWQHRAHFYAVAARVMRRVLIDHARSRARAKRGGASGRVTLNEEVMAAGSGDLDAHILDRALDRLEALDERKARFVEMRYLAGLSNREIAEAAGVSERTVKRELQFGRPGCGVRSRSTLHDRDVGAGRIVPRRCRKSPGRVARLSGRARG